MSLKKLNIPEKINVGFQNRQGTYTGKLAYVVYTDAKGILRKEKSWSGWRDKAIDPQEFDNEPTSGFVLNKKVGETRYGWNPRRAWVRVYDPRDFEFEISVANLLFILEECSAIKGKGLEGEFVYAWDRAELVLLPVTSQEYISSKDFSKLRTKKVTKADMQEGCIYKTKDGDEVMYLGRHDYYAYNQYSRPKRFNKSKYHIFVSIDGKSKLRLERGFTQLAERLTDEPSQLYADEYDKFKKSINGTCPSEIKPIPIKFNFDTFWSSSEEFMKKGKEFRKVRIEKQYGRDHDKYKLTMSELTPVEITNTGIIIEPESPNLHLSRNKIITRENLESMHFYTLMAKNEHGAQIQI